MHLIAYRSGRWVTRGGLVVKAVSSRAASSTAAKSRWTAGASVQQERVIEGTSVVWRYGGLNETRLITRSVTINNCHHGDTGSWPGM